MGLAGEGVLSRIKCFMVELVEPGFRNVENGELYPDFKSLPPGAMFYAHASYQPRNPGPDGRWLIVVTPGGQWDIDAKANNCTMPDDWEHHCWVRHGVPPEITVDKNGHTCGCGCSIGIGDGNGGYRYHGFLRNGFLEEC